MASAENLVEELEEKMMSAMESMESDFQAIRTGKASPSLVEGLLVDYYGTQTRLKDIAGITTPEPRMLVIQPWDTNAISNIEKAINASNLGITPQNDGRVVRLPIPELSEERRRDMSKQVKKRAEDAKIVIRNQRRDANDAAKKFHKGSEITEDDLTAMLKDIQDLTDKSIKDIDASAKKKEDEVMSI